MNTDSRDDVAAVTAQFEELLRELFAGKLNYPSRVRYLDAIVATLRVIVKSHRYIILALNSSVSVQRILGEDGYDFKHYFEIFRERLLCGDDIVRVFCLIPSAANTMRPSTQLGNIHRIIQENGLEDCLNVYKTRPQGFNCVYILPALTNSPDYSAFRLALGRAKRPGENALQEVIRLLPEVVDFDNSIFFREFHDYDVKNAASCGYRFVPSDPREARAIVDEYSNILRDASMLTDFSALAEIGHIDIGLIVALPVEFQALKCRLDHLHPVGQSSGIAFYRGRLMTSSGHALSVLIAQLPDTGNILSAMAASLMIERFAVRYIINVGIAGGLRGEVELGDVVIGKTIVYYEKKKVSAGHEEPDFRTHEFNFSNVSAAHHPTRYLSKIVANLPSKGIDNPKPNRAILDCAILSGEKVLIDPEILRASRAQVARKILAVENEAAGVYLAAHLNGSQVQYVAVKGISDYADPEKGDDWHEYAADAAAAYTVDLVEHMAIRPF